jgi:hypothetical protein
MSATKQEVQSVLQVVLAVADAIKEFGPEGVPSGHLYAHLMGKLSIHVYTAIIEQLKSAGLVRESGHVLYFVGGAR